MRRAAKVDANQQEIVNALRGAMLSVAVTSAIGGGFPDAVVGLPNANVLVEIKAEGGKLTAPQVRFHETWTGPILVVRSVEEAFLGLERWR